MCLARIQKFKPVEFGYVVARRVGEKNFGGIYLSALDPIGGYRIGKWHVARRLSWWGRERKTEGFHIFHFKKDAELFRKNCTTPSAVILRVQGDSVIKTGCQKISTGFWNKPRYAKVTCVRRRKILKVVGR